MTQQQNQQYIVTTGVNTKFFLI